MKNANMSLQVWPESGMAHSAIVACCGAKFLPYSGKQDGCPYLLKYLIESMWLNSVPSLLSATPCLEEQS